MTSGARTTDGPRFSVAVDERGTYIGIDGSRFHVVREAEDYLVQKYGWGRRAAAAALLRVLFVEALGVSGEELSRHIGVMKSEGCEE